MIDTTTKFWKVELNVDETDQAIIEAAQMLQRGNIVAFPTETVYGLGANALDTKAIKKIYKAKGRPSDNPLIVHIATIEQLQTLVHDMNETSQKLIENFWPGPLTIIFNSRNNISELVTAGLSTIAVRMPDHPVALAIIKAANLPIAAPSANKSGSPSPTTASHVWADLHGLIEGIIDGGSTKIGVESTVIDVTGDVPTILRPGGITVEEIERVIGKVRIDKGIVDEAVKPISPGMKYRHYAPKGEMIILKGTEENIIQAVNSLILEKKADGKRVGVLTTKEHKVLYGFADLTLAFGTRSNLDPLAENLYDALRTFDIENIDYIIAEAVEETGIGLAIMNRIKKAANSKMINI